jgi:hypothetical protein
MTAGSTKALLLVISALALLIAGCGGGSSDESTGAGSGTPVPTSSLSKEEFISQATATCQGLRKNLLENVLAYTEKHEGKNPSRAEETEVFAGMTKAVLLPVIRKELIAIRHLGAPSGDEDEIESFLASEQEAIDSIMNLKHIVSRFEIERYFVPSAKIAREYGLEGCANGS